MKDETIITHDGQKYLDDFLKEENKECLNCEENQNKICNSITCDWYNVPIIEINEDYCIHKVKIRTDDEEVIYQEKSLLESL